MLRDLRQHLHLLRRLPLRLHLLLGVLDHGSLRYISSDLSSGFC